MILDREATIEKLAALTAEARRTAPARRLPRDVHPRLPELGLGEVPRRLGRPARQGRVRHARARVRRDPGAAPTGSARSRRARGLARHRRQRARPGAARHALQRAPLPRPDGASRSATGSSCRRTTSGSSGARATAAACAPSTELGRIGGLICWENYMPLARFSLYESGVEIYIASTADDGDAWQATLVHIARESRAFVVSPSHFQRAPLVPGRFPLRDRSPGRDPRTRRLGDPRARTALPRRPAVRRGGDPLRRTRPAAPRRGAAALRPGRALPPAGRAPAKGRRAVEPVTLVDAENVRRSQWPNIGREEIVELVLRWADATGAHALVVSTATRPTSEHPTVKVVGTTAESADDRIARDAESSPRGRPYRLVTSDRGLRGRAGARRGPGRRRDFRADAQGRHQRSQCTIELERRPHPKRELGTGHQPDVCFRLDSRRRPSSRVISPEQILRFSSFSILSTSSACGRGSGQRLRGSVGWPPSSSEIRWSSW